MSEKIRDVPWYEHENARDIVCPHCGNAHEDETYRDDGDVTEMECEGCGHEFRFTTTISITYTSEKMPGDEAEDSASPNRQETP